MAISQEQKKLFSQIRDMASRNEVLNEEEFAQKLSAAGDRKPKETLQKAIKEGACLSSAKSVWEEGGSLEEGKQMAEAALGSQLPTYIHSLLEKEYSLINAQNRIKDNYRHKNELKNNPTFNKTFQPVEAKLPELKVKRETPVISHPNSLSSLIPSSEWWILVDETGMFFDEKMYSSKKKDQGRIVAIFLGDKDAIPRLPDHWHAVDQTWEEVRNVTQTLLHAKNCGVLGILLGQTSIIHGDQWLPGIEMIFEMALRLLPIKGPTRLNLRVEQRELKPENSKYLQLVCEGALKRFARFDPKKAGLISVQANIIEKDKNPRLAYADAVAMTWSGTSMTTVLKDSQWKGTCLLETNIEPLLAALSETPTPEMWSDLISSSESEMENSFVSAILNNMGEAVREDTDLWQSFMNIALQELESKRIDLRKVGHQIDWLKRFCPSKGQIPPSLELCWRTVQLANSNHHGGAMNNKKELEDFNSLIDLVLPEDARLACFAALHLSVSFTNIFKFETARGVLEKWTKIDPLAVGRNYSGRLESSLGQIEAFVENKTAALEHFRQAIAIFNELTDPIEAQMEIGQTRAYLLTTLMDCAAHDGNYRQELLAEVERYFPLPLNEMAQQFAVSNDPQTKYHHSLFLRLLAQDPSEDFESACQEYLKLRSEWKTDVGHPWEMIEFYRGILLTEPEERLNCFRRAYELVRGEAGVLRVIGAVILGSILPLDSSVLEEYEALMTALSEEFPDETNRLSVLKSQPTEKLLPLDLAERVLTFNFR
ncbi:MAG: hypothetical protein K6C40_09490 [Thermoguttaceae bacterium]|nr:hypothetical protein [Thermoguttaceae bacterium]